MRCRCCRTAVLTTAAELRSGWCEPCEEDALTEQTYEHGQDDDGDEQMWDAWADAAYDQQAGGDA